MTGRRTTRLRRIGPCSATSGRPERSTRRTVATGVDGNSLGTSSSSAAPTRATRMSTAIRPSPSSRSAYCRRTLTKLTRTRDHVIPRVAWRIEPAIQRREGVRPLQQHEGRPHADGGGSRIGPTGRRAVLEALAAAAPGLPIGVAVHNNPNPPAEEAGRWAADDGPDCAAARTRLQPEADAVSTDLFARCARRAAGSAASRHRKPRPP